MKRLFFILILLLGIAECVANNTSSEQQSEWIGFVQSSSLNMRSGPGSEYEIVERLPNNAKVDLINENYYPLDNEEWVEVCYNGKSGYVAKEYMSIQKNHFKRHHYNQKRYPGLSLLPVPAFMPPKTPLWLWNLGMITLVCMVIFWIVFQKNGFISPFKSALAFALSCSVIFYVLSFGEHAMWFFSLTETGDDLGYLLINGVLLFVLIVVQFILSFSVYSEYDVDNLFPSYAAAVIGGGCFLVALIVSKFWVESFVWIGITIVIISQIIQCAIVWRKTTGLVAICILIVSSATILLCIPLMYIMVAVAAAVIAKGLASTSGSSGSSRHGVSVPPNLASAVSDEKVFLEDAYGKKVEVELDSSGMNAIEKNSMTPRKFRKKVDGSFEEY